MLFPLSNSGRQRKGFRIHAIKELKKLKSRLVERESLETLLRYYKK